MVSLVYQQTLRLHIQYVSTCSGNSYITSILLKRHRASQEDLTKNINETINVNMNVHFFDTSKYKLKYKKIATK